MPYFFISEYIGDADYLEKMKMMMLQECLLVSLTSVETLLHLSMALTTTLVSSHPLFL
jgi:hypothetical protein